MIATQFAGYSYCYSTIPTEGIINDRGILGKADAHVTRLAPDLPGAVPGPAPGTLYQPDHNKYDLGYPIGELRPDYVEDFAWGSQSLSGPEYGYVTKEYEGIALTLRKGSKEGLWDKLP